MRKWLGAVTALATAAAVTSTTGTALADYSLSILHFNDFHARFEPINRFDSTCKPEDDAEGKCFGGIARIKTKVDERRAALDKIDRPNLFLIAGDMFQGSLYYTAFKGRASASFMNSMGVDAFVLGNHEFDDGPPVLADFLAATNFPTIAGNVYFGSEPSLKGKVPPYLIVEAGGEKIGIIGVVTTDTAEIAAPGENIAFIDTIRYLDSIVPEVEAQGTNKIIVLSHVGYAEDLAIAKAVRGIDVIVGGHTNTLLSNADPKADGPYPVMVENPDGKKTAIVQVYAYSKYLGELTVKFDDNGDVVFATGNTHLLDAKVKADEAFAARLAGLSAELDKVRNAVVGSAAAVIDGNRESCRVQECAMGNLVADAMLQRVKDQGVSIAIQNGGGLRASIDDGEITMGEVLTVLPFQNTLSTFQLKGSDVIAALENGVSQVEEVKGRFPQVAGLRYAWDPAAEPLGGRIKQAQVMADGGWVDIDPDAAYGLVSNNYMRGGGDGYKVFRDNGMNAYDYGPSLEEVVADYLANNQPYAPYTDGRIIQGASFMMAKADDTAMEKDEEMASDDKMMAGDYVVKRGDNLWNIAKDHYGDPMVWPKISDANKLRNPDIINIGQELMLP